MSELPQHIETLYFGYLDAYRPKYQRVTDLVERHGEKIKLTLSDRFSKPSSIKKTAQFRYHMPDIEDDYGETSRVVERDISLLMWRDRNVVSIVENTFTPTADDESKLWFSWSVTHLAESGLMESFNPGRFIVSDDEKSQQAVLSGKYGPVILHFGDDAKAVGVRNTTPMVSLHPSVETRTTTLMDGEYSGQLLQRWMDDITLFDQRIAFMDVNDQTQ